jgi:hypothetical protein
MLVEDMLWQKINKISITDIELSTADPNATLDYATVEALAGDSSRSWIS